MKKLMIFSAVLLCSNFSRAQYVGATAPETAYGAMVPSSCTYNDIGMDTRSAGGSSIFGGGSSYYLNYTNVTVNSCRDMSTGSPTFYWENSSGLTGNSPLPVDAQDPDVVMVSDPGSNNIWAIAVYYLSGAGGYGMSVASFTPGSGFNPMFPTTWFHPYTGAIHPHINIDSDSRGNYGIVLQHSADIRSFTATTIGSGPNLPGNMRIDAGLIEPDLAFGINSSNYSLNIIALNNSRSRYVNYARDFIGTSITSTYVSPTYSDLYEPRIAAPASGGINNYAITVMRKHAVGVNTNFDILFEINETGTKVANNGTTPFLPPINVNNENILPALSYAYAGPLSGERICFGWWVETIGPGPGVPNQARTFIGIETDVAGNVLGSVNNYRDISNLNGLNNRSTVALSGRYMDWGKSTAYTYENPGAPGFAERLIWKITPTGTPNWKPAGTTELSMESLSIVPNPVSDYATIQFDDMSISAEFEVYNQLGQMVHSGTIEDGTGELSTANWESGVYIVHVQTSTSKETLRFLKN